MQTNTTFGDRGEGWVLAQFALLAAIAFAPRRRGAFSPLVKATGAVVGIAGAAIAALGARSLGPNLTPLPHPRENSQLVDTGIYSLVRHPIYTGISLGALGWSLLRESVVGIVLSLALSLFFDGKAAREEHWLQARYSGYAAYKQRVSKLLPRLY